MTPDIIFMFLLLVTVIIVFILDKFPMDLVALSVVAILALSGIISPNEAVSGFGNSLIVMIAGLFIVGEGLFATGIANLAGNTLLKVGGKSETHLLLFLLPLVAFLSAFMSSTGAVALLIPIVLSMARKSSMQSGRLFMPLAFASLIGGMITLIGTPPNIIVSAQMSEAGLDSFDFFDFTPIGAIILFVGIVYLIIVGKFLLPKSTTRENRAKNKTIDDFIGDYTLTDQLHELSVKSNSSLIGKTIKDIKPRRDYEVTPFALKHSLNKATTLVPVLLNTPITSGDTLWVYSNANNLTRFTQDYDLIVKPHTVEAVKTLQKQFGFAEVMIPPDSTYVGRTLMDAKFREFLKLNAIGVVNKHVPKKMIFTESKLTEGDCLLLTGSWADIRALINNRDLVVLETPIELEEIPIHDKKASTAGVIMLAMLVMMTTGWLPNLTAIIVAALAMILTNCVTLKEAYRSLNTASLVLIAGMLPVAKAMEKSGAVDYLVQNMMVLLDGVSPLTVCAVFFVLTSLLSQFISNTATTVLLAPIALNTAIVLGYAPEGFMMTVAIAASTSFATPIASPVNTLVLSPGKYCFFDFVKVGVPLQLITLAITLAMVPILFPF